MALHDGGDWLRFFVVAEGFILAGFAIAVMTEARKFRAPPRHVLAIASSYILLILGYITEVTVRLGDSWGWRTFVALISFSFGLYAMWLMWRAYQYASRLERHDKQTIVAGNELMKQAFEQKKEKP